MSELFKNFLTETGKTNTVTGGVNTPEGTLICLLAALAIGIFIAAVYACGGRRSRSMMLTLAVMPLLVQVVILMVNGNIGAGVAVMGAFNLVRFRSIPGKSIDISYIFFAMACGITAGMGMLYFAGVIALGVGVILFLGERLMGVLSPRFAKTDEKQLRITIPEDLNYTECFDEIFAKFTDTHTLERVKTTNMGMMFELTYRIRLKNSLQEKAMLDEIRVRNGNLQIICGKLPSEMEAL
ncbi:MAG: DUF4956 domain-containing protein [Oscillospiraceae bacterium]